MSQGQRIKQCTDLEKSLINMRAALAKIKSFQVVGKHGKYSTEQIGKIYILKLKKMWLLKYIKGNFSLHTNYIFYRNKDYLRTNAIEG